MSHRPERSSITTRRRRPPFRLRRSHGGFARRALTALINPAVERALAFDRLNEVYEITGRFGDDRPFAQKGLDALNIRIDINQAELDRIPDTGPVIAVANHPFGAVDGLILLAILQQARPDTRVMANHLLGRIRELRSSLIGVDPFGGPDARSRNLGPLKRALAWLREGHALGTFPAGEVAHFHPRQRAIVDPAWSTTVARLAQRAGATVLPVYFHGRNSQLFQLLGMIHPRLRTVMLPRELLKKRTSTITVRIGHPLSPQRIAEFDDDQRLTEHIRMRTYLLAAGLHRRRQRRFPLHRPAEAAADFEAIVDPVDPDLIEAELAELPAEAKLLENGDQVIYAAEADRLPNILHEIGRLREITFRAVGEGTGKPIDLDRFDRTYLHLFVWDRAQRNIVGAYRVGRTDQIVPEHGVAGLYTSTLFDFGRNLIDELSPAIELGRSFVVPEYQRSFAPLMNLWKGIGVIISRDPRIARLFGPVSISNDYHDLSRRLIVEFMTANNLAPELARLCHARNPMRRPRRGRIAKGVDSIALQSIDQVSDLIADIERQPRGVPILLKQYLRLGAQLLAFNIDPDFGDVLDGMVVVDLRRTDPKILAKYMGKAQAMAFLDYHAEA